MLQDYIKYFVGVIFVFTSQFVMATTPETVVPVNPVNVPVAATPAPANGAAPVNGATPAKTTTDEKASLFVEGQDYIRLPPQIRNNPDVQQLINADPNKVQVLFFFSYGCHGCEMFHAPFEKWAAKQAKNPDNKAVFYRYPVSFNPQWAMLAKMYFVMETLDPSGKLNNAIFNAIHKQGLKLWQEPVMKKFFIKNGYTGQQFDSAFTSFNVNRQTKRADELTKAYNIVITPDIVVNGPTASYQLDLAKKGNTPERLLRILDYLIKRESKLLPN